MSSIAYSFAVTTSAPQIMPAGTVEHPNLITLLSYWEHLRGPDPMPARVEARKDVSSLLKYLHLCDVMDHGENFRFNVIGDAVFQGLSENPVGHLVSEHPDMGVRLRFPILMREVVRTKNPVRGLAIRETQRGSFHAESIWLPFGGPDAKQILGMTMFAIIGSDQQSPQTGPQRPSSRL